MTALLSCLLICNAHTGVGDLHHIKPKPPARIVATKPKAKPSEKRAFDSPNEAAAFYYYSRADKDGNWPPNAIMVAKQQRDAMLLADGGGVFPGSWTSFGPGNIGGRIRAIVIHPTQTNTIWIAGIAGGVWKTTNGGTTWVPQDEFMANLGVSTMVINTTDPNILYAGTGEGFYNTGIPGTSNNAFKQGNGIFKTYDGGTTWNQLASTANNPDFYYCNRLAISPTDPNVLLCATNTGIFRTTDGGATWTQTSTARTFDVDFHPTDGNKVVAGRADGIAQYSNDGGVTWTNATGISIPNDRVELQYAKSQPTTIYAAVSSVANGTIKVWRSTDSGVTYSLMTTGSGITTYVNYNNALWVDPTLPSRLMLGGVNMYRSTNSGASFSSAFNLHADHHAIVEDPGYNGTTNRIVYFGNDGGIYRTTDITGSSATELNNGLGITQFYGAAINNTSGRVLAGAQDNGTNLYTGNPNGWVQNVIGGDGGFCAADPTDPNYFYGESQYANISRSSNGGTSFSGSLSVPEAGQETFNFIPFFMLDPNNANRMLVCGRRIYRANNVKTGSPPTWTVIKNAIAAPSQWEPPGAHFEALDPRNASTIAVAEGNSDLIWVGYNNGQVWKTTNGTATTPTWTRMDQNYPGGLPQRFVSRIVIDRNDHNRVYVAMQGWTPDNLWRTTDGGATWQSIVGSGTSALISAPVGGFAQNRINPNWLYAGTDLGIFTSSDDGATWSAVTDGPNTAPVAEMVWRNDTQLLVATMGRGVFQATINNNEEPVSPASFSLLRGIRLSGRLQELFRSDDAYLNLRPGVVLSSAEAPVQLVLNARAPIPTCTGMKFAIESAANQANVGQTVSLFNFQTSSYEDLDTRTITTADQSIDVVVTGDPNRFIDSTTRSLRAKISFKPTGPILNYPWNVRIDLTKWTLNP